MNKLLLRQSGLRTEQGARDYVYRKNAARMVYAYKGSSMSKEHIAVVQLFVGLKVPFAPGGKIAWMNTEDSVCAQHILRKPACKSFLSTGSRRIILSGGIGRQRTDGVGDLFSGIEICFDGANAVSPAAHVGLHGACNEIGNAARAACLNWRDQLRDTGGVLSG